MRKVDELSGLLKKIQEQDDAVADIATEPVPPSSDMGGGEGEPLPPPSYDNEFFKQLRVNDVFIDQDNPEIQYKVVGDPVMDTENPETVVSLQCEVVEAPEGNEKGVAVGDTFDAITSMPQAGGEPSGGGEPTGGDFSGGEPPAGGGGDATIDTPPTEAKKDNKPAWKKKIVKTSNAAAQPGAKKGRKGEGYSLKRRFPGKIREFLTTGIVQEERSDGLVIRMGKWHKVVPKASGAKVGDTVEMEGDKITKVISSQSPPVFSKEK